MRRGALGHGGWLDLDAAIDETTEQVIIADRPEMFAIARAVRRRMPHVRVVLWCWNLVPADWLPRDANTFEVATFDPGDAGRYGWRPASTHYFREFQQHARTEKDYDLVFIGRDKGRRDLIHHAADLARSVGGRAHINIVAPDEPYVPYRQVLATAGRSRAVLDIVQEGQQGLTLRAMEALFLGVRLITNNDAVLNAEHYPSENVWLLGRDNSAGFSDWLHDEPAAPKSAALDYYDFDAWLDRVLG
jgi:hypothetical protein